MHAGCRTRGKSVVSPADGGPILSADSASVRPAAGDRTEPLAVGRGRASISVGPPADRRAIRAKSAATVGSVADDRKRLTRRRGSLAEVVLAPADGSPVLAKPARMTASGAHGNVYESLALRRRLFPEPARAPADRGAVFPQSAGVCVAAGEFRESLPCRCNILP